MLEKHFRREAVSTQREWVYGVPILVHGGKSIRNTVSSTAAPLQAVDVDRKSIYTLLFISTGVDTVHIPVEQVVELLSALDVDSLDHPGGFLDDFDHARPTRHVTM